MRLGHTPTTARLAPTRLFRHESEPRTQRAGALGGTRETTIYNLKMLESGVGDHSIGIRAPDLGGVALDDILVLVWD